MTTRTAAILSAVQREIVSRKTSLDAATDLVVVTITVKLTPGAAWVRGTEYCEERRCIAPPTEKHRV